MLRVLNNMTPLFLKKIFVLLGNATRVLPAEKLINIFKNNGEMWSIAQRGASAAGIARQIRLYHTVGAGAYAQIRAALLARLDSRPHAALAVVWRADA